MKMSPTPKLSQCCLCDERFARHRDLSQHTRDVHAKSPCPTCNKGFTSKALVDHQKAKKHAYCVKHQVVFDSISDYEKHKKSKLHFTGFLCTICCKELQSDNALKDHLKSTGHAQKAEIAAKQKSEDIAAALATLNEEKILRCESCNRSFKSLPALRHHKKSLAHNPLSDLKCPFSSKCNAIFTAPSALIAHIESGRCGSGMDRDSLNAVVYEYDNDRSVTLKDHVVLKSVNINPTSFGFLASRRFNIGAIGSSDGDTDSTTSDDGGVLVSREDATPSEFSIVDPPSEFSIDGASGNNDWVLLSPNTGADSRTTNSAKDAQTKRLQCNQCHRTFRQHDDLQQHLDSVAHAPAIFHCPTNLLTTGSGTKRAMFKTLSGVAQHIESGACKGGLRMLRAVSAILEREIHIKFGSRIKLLRAGV